MQSINRNTSTSITVSRQPFNAHRTNKTPVQDFSQQSCQKTCPNGQSGIGLLSFCLRKLLHKAKNPPFITRFARLCQHPILQFISNIRVNLVVNP